MKIPPKTLDSFIKSPPRDILALLLYGPEKGLALERLNVLTKQIVPDLNDAFNIVEMTGDSLSDNPARLQDEIMAISMLGGRRVVRLRDATDKNTDTIKAALKNIQAADALLLVEAGELGPRSTLRLLFENADNAVAVPCYIDERGTIGIVMGESLRSAGFTISGDALQYMAANVIGDRGVARSEVEKLITYMGDNKKITMDDVMASVGDSAALFLDDLAKNVASGNLLEAEKILQHVLSEGETAVAVLRNLQNYFAKLHLTKSRMQQGESMEVAIGKIKPPLFFKLKPAFEAQLYGWSSLQLEEALAQIMSTEAKCKQTGSSPELLCSRLILVLSKIGERATGARRRA